MKIIIIFSFTGLLFYQCLSFSQEFNISKSSNTYPVSNHSIIYALPRTGLTINIILTKTSIKKGIYAEYARKYLNIENVPLADSTYWSISNIEIIPFNEPDPEHFYSLTFKTTLSNIQTLLSKDNYGIILNPSDKWLTPYKSNVSPILQQPVTDPGLLDETIFEQVDTFYKTILNDTSFIRVPVFKKQIVAKSYEDLIKETAHQLIKTRKIRLKLARGEYDFHPDASTLKVMFEEMKKQEETYLMLFQGSKTEIKETFSTTLFLTKDFTKTELCFFSNKYGISNQSDTNSKVISLRINNESALSTSPQPLNNKQETNILYYRVPGYVTTTVSGDNKELIKARIPIFQFGIIQSFFISPK